MGREPACLPRISKATPAPLSTQKQTHLLGVHGMEAAAIASRKGLASPVPGSVKWGRKGQDPLMGAVTTVCGG